MNKPTKIQVSLSQEQQMQLTLEQQATNYQTLLHIVEVQKRLLQMAALLHERCFTHDQSKLAAPEVEIFTEFTPKLKGTTYGSPEYKQFLADMKPALDNHYANNSHHPEHYPDGVAGMNLIDLVEMLCDWMASSMRHDDGCPYKSVEINTKRFKLDPQIASIYNNTLKMLGIEPKEQQP